MAATSCITSITYKGSLRWTVRAKQGPLFASALLISVHFQKGLENDLQDLVPPVKTMVATLSVYPFTKSLRRRGRLRLDDVVNFVSLALETGQVEWIQICADVGATVLISATLPT
ncbi:uncharacterized protein ARMOST_02587 [Armillaria ostoyae]|uniref:Uncharacterized protein n=1 Tax=Armillaria ostoyae TaxID=47428 RepID=A0A284QS52_ARMOS|nr:uncharacterized protein ARMOST_02587 [Armillaria ostoyae]